MKEHSFKDKFFFLSFMATCVQEDDSISIVAQEIANTWIQNFLDSMESLWEMKTLQFSRQEKKIMEHDRGEVLKIRYRDLTDYIK